jgi:uncharacterized protein (TIGR04255 family)
MKLPKNISPCPISEAVAEVRFEPNVPTDAVFGIVYQALKRDFAEVEPLPILSLPANIRTGEKDLTFQPYYRLNSEMVAILIGPRVISVGMRAEYPGWAIHCHRIKDALSQFYQTGILKRTLRFGLRYINFFVGDIYPSLQLNITVNGTALGGDETFFKTVLDCKGCRSLLQIGKGLTLVNKPGETGSVIDIDTFSTETNGEFVPSLEAFLDDAHQAEKELFFRLLKPEFVNTLNPVYGNGN